MADLLQAWSEELNVLDRHARTKERFDQAPAIKDLQHRWLEGGAARLVMWREPALHDARLDAMAEEFTGGKQSGRAGSDNEDGC